MSTSSGLGLKKIAGNATITLGRQLMAGVLQLITVIIIARILGPEGNGQYAIAILLPMMLATFLNLGIAPANVYFLGSGKVGALTVFLAIKRMGLFIVVVGVGVGASCIYFFSDDWFPNVPRVFLWGALLIFPFALFHSFLLSIFQGLQKFKIYNLILLTQPIVTFFLVLIAAMFKITDLEYFIAAHMIGFVVVVSIGLRKVRIETVGEEITEQPQKYSKRAITYGYKAHLGNILAFTNYKADIFLVNLLVNPAAAGIYVIAVQITERLELLSRSVSTVILPRLSELTNDEEKRKQVTPIVSRTIIAVTLILAILLACLVFPFITLFFGSEYLEAVWVVIFLLPGSVAHSGARILANDIAARGRPELNMYFATIVVTANISGNILLIPRYGLEGAAIATSCAYTLNLFLRVLVYKQISGNSLLAPIMINTDDIARVLRVLKK